MMREGYAKVFELDLKTATIGQVQEKIGSYGPTGATRKRAARFFSRLRSTVALTCHRG